MIDDFEYYSYQLRKGAFKVREINESAGKCPSGCSIYDEDDKEMGFKYCPICGDEIEWF